MTRTQQPGMATAAPKRRYVPAVGPRLARLLWVVFGLFALLGVNAVYLVSVRVMEHWTGLGYQNYFYQYMFLGHLALGLAIVVPVVVFGILHIRNAANRPNKRAVRAGYALFATSLAVLISGVVLTRLEGIIVVKDPATRGIAYWAHVISPLAVIWLFVLHRLAGRRIRWRLGLGWAAVSAAFAGAMVLLHSQDPRAWNRVGPESGERYFFPSLSRTSTGDFIPAASMMQDQYCLKCHADVHAGWSHSMHRFSSFNNPAYLFSVLNTRKVIFARDGNVQGARFCAGCHDPVPFFSGAFDDPKFDDPAYDLAGDALAQAGITCSVCHGVSAINSPRGNGDYTIEEPAHYPFAFSENGLLQWINNQLIKAKPDFHKRTFLKPLHRSAEFCGTCHKVHLPEELNAYRFLRGQNHYDSFLLSGVSGHGVSSFYYPAVAETNCNGCHMPLAASDDFGARDFDTSGVLTVHDHQFPSANTAIPHLLDMPESVIEAHRTFNEGVMRLDIFGIKEDAAIDGALTAPLPESLAADAALRLQPGRRYLLEIVIRTLKMGHLFTQGTADSNEVWLDVVLKQDGRIIGRSGALGEGDRAVDPWSHFVNAFVIDRDGRRIDRRNAEDIFISLYNHQIPPGAADVVHYAFEVPPGLSGDVTVEAKLQYRKFDSLFMQHFQGEAFDTNDLPIMTLASDALVLPVAGGAGAADIQPAGDGDFPPWQRWNDYGIGLLRKGDSGKNRGELRQAAAAFTRVAALGHGSGEVNLARVALKEGDLDRAAEALHRAAEGAHPAPTWSIAWFTAQVNKQNGFLDESIDNLRTLIRMKHTAECRERGLDFTRDYRLLIELGQTIFERSKRYRGSAQDAQRRVVLAEARSWFERALALDPENVSAHHNMALVCTELEDEACATRHRALHAGYKPDDNARDRAIAVARTRYPAANHAAEDIVIYDLQRPGAFGLPAAFNAAVNPSVQENLTAAGAESAETMD